MTELIRSIVDAFKAQREELVTQASVDELHLPGEVVKVGFEVAGHVVLAHWNGTDRVFTQLEASPLDGPSAGEPGVTFVITPPEGETW